MATLSELIGRTVTPEAKDCYRPKADALSLPIAVKSRKPHGQYESEVFNFLLANKEVLGIRSITKFKNLLVDGAVELMDGKRRAVEVKLRMNWLKACQAEWQFRTFVKRMSAEHFPVDGGIVIFEEFSGDWKTKAGCRLLENGWSHWYRDHSEVDGLPLGLLRLHAGKIEAFPIADALMRQLKSMNSEELNHLLSGLSANDG